MSNPDTYNPPSAIHGESAQIAYDFGYREAQLGNGFWGKGSSETLLSIFPVGTSVIFIGEWYGLGYRHGIGEWA